MINMNQKLKNIGRIILCFLIMLFLIYSLFLVTAYILESFNNWGGRSFASIRIHLMMMGIFLMIVYLLIDFYKIFKFNEIIISLIVVEILICIFAFPQIYHCLIKSYWDLVYRYTLYFIEGTIYSCGNFNWHDYWKTFIKRKSLI